MNITLESPYFGLKEEIRKLEQLKKSLQTTNADKLRKIIGDLDEAFLKPIDEMNTIGELATRAHDRISRDIADAHQRIKEILPEWLTSVAALEEREIINPGYRPDSLVPYEHGPWTQQGLNELKKYYAIDLQLESTLGKCVSERRQIIAGNLRKVQEAVSQLKEKKDLVTA